MPHFQTFKKSLVPFGRQPQVTIQKRGTITLNAAAYAALGSPEAVELLYDSDERVVGLRPVSAKVEHAAFVRPSTKSGTGPYVISAMAFIKFYKIETSTARRWPGLLDGTMLRIDLNGDFLQVSKHTDDRGDGPRTPARRPRPRPGTAD